MPDVRIQVVSPVESVEPYLNFALPLYEGRDAAHDANHIRRIVARLAQLSQDVQPPPRAAVVHFLACFHGLVSRVLEEDRLRLQIEGLLTGLGWSASEIDEGLLLLSRHCIDPRTPEECIVHDANYVEVLGAFGIAKAFTKGGAKGQSYEETIAIFRENLDRVDF